MARLGAAAGAAVLHAARVEVTRVKFPNDIAIGVREVVGTVRNWLSRRFGLGGVVWWIRRRLGSMGLLGRLVSDLGSRGSLGGSDGGFGSMGLFFGSPPGRTHVSEVAGRTLRKASKRCTRCTRSYHGTRLVSSIAYRFS